MQKSVKLMIKDAIDLLLYWFIYIHHTIIINIIHYGSLDKEV